jgi:hypothetical protein
MSTESIERLTKKKISELTEAENIYNNDVFIVSSKSEITDNGYVWTELSGALGSVNTALETILGV